MSEQKRANKVDTHVGRRILMARKLANMSQEKLAENLGITFQQVQKYEKGTNRISAGRLFEIARIVDEPVSFFYQGLSGTAQDEALAADKPGDHLSDPLATAEGLELNRHFATIRDPKIRRKIVELVGALAQEDARGRESKNSRPARAATA